MPSRKQLTKSSMQASAFGQKRRSPPARKFTGRGIGAFVRYFIGAPLAVLLSITVLIALLEHQGYFKGVWALDSLLVKHFATLPQSDEVFIVSITDQDYYSPLFGGTSPLRPTSVKRLVCKLVQYQPRVIGVDLDTSDWQENESPNDCPEVRICRGKACVERTTALYWANIPVSSEKMLRSEDDSIALGPVRGRNFVDTKRMGVPLFPLDPDGVVRRYVGAFKVLAPQGTSQEIRSFARAVAEHYFPSLNISKEERFLRFSIDEGQFRRFPAQQVLKAKDDDQDLRRVRDRIVLIGGVFNASRDRYYTPVGDRWGVVLNAMAVDSDLHNRGIRELSTSIVTAADFLMGMTSIYLFFRLRRHPYRAFLVLTGGGILADIILSWVLFAAAAFWVNFVPVLASVNVHQLWDHVRILKEEENERAIDASP